MCHQLWAFSALQTAAVAVPVAVVPMETRLIRNESCMGGLLSSKKKKKKLVLNLGEMWSTLNFRNIIDE